MKLCRYTQEIVEQTIAHIKDLMSKNTELSDLSLALPEVKAPKATIIFSDTADMKRKELVKQSSKEIAWHMLITKSYNEEHVYYTVEDIIMFPQMVTAATVTSDDTEYAQWITALDDNTFNKVRGHGHSHVNMGVTPSGVDTDYQDAIKQNIEDFYVFEIINKKGDQWIMIYDVEDNIMYDKKDIEIVDRSSTYSNWAKLAMEKFIKEPSKPTPSAKSAGYKYWQEQALGKIDAAKSAANEPEEDWYTKDSFWEEWEKANAEYGYHI